LYLYKYTYITYTSQPCFNYITFFLVHIIPIFIHYIVLYSCDAIINSKMIYIYFIFLRLESCGQVLQDSIIRSIIRRTWYLYPGIIIYIILVYTILMYKYRYIQNRDGRCKKKKYKLYLVTNKINVCVATLWSRITSHIILYTIYIIQLVGNTCLV